MSTRPSGRLISTTSAHHPSPSAPISTSLKTQATYPPSVRERARKYPTAVAPPISRRSPSTHSCVDTGSAERRSLTNRVRKNFATGPAAERLARHHRHGDYSCPITRNRQRSEKPLALSRPLRKAPRKGAKDQ